nr:KH domain-containing protein [Candidatus Levybacteria bacterium]
MKDTLNYIISSIVEDPKAVEIKEEEQDGVLNFIVTVADEDMGRIIGKGGKVIRSIRNVMKIPAIKANKKIYISLSQNPQ